MTTLGQGHNLRRVKICRYLTTDNQVRIGLAKGEDTLLDLSPAGIESITALLESSDAAQRLANLGELPETPLADVKLLSPIEVQEVWAAGVTYLRSKDARMEESDFSATAYDRVYDAPRPELFFKSLPEKVVACGEPVGIRTDANWSVPEPELVLMMNSRGEIAGYAVGNDMSSRDIEGENLLYLPQAKVYHRSCAVGPWVRVGATEEEAREWEIKIQIERSGGSVFDGSVGVNQIKRGFGELRDFLFESQLFPFGCVLLTGTGIVPGDDFTLEEGDTVRIHISGIGCLNNPVVRV
ncbi:MAG: fumarylacetoacetate hydrolase family protein [Verrucomicrobiota bacterium]|nr:fumarylacetoacetate hydrolase family protein [Verrucomicrobiota bacterium]